MLQSRFRLTLLIVAVLFACRTVRCEEVDKAKRMRELLGARAEGVTVILSTEKPTVRLGEPIKVNLDMRYDGAQPHQYDSQSVAVHDSFDIKGAKGNTLRYIEPPAQTGGGPRDIQPGETVAIRRGVDLTDKYLFQEPGQYTIQFLGDSGAISKIGFPPSNTVTLVVQPGEMPPVDKLVAQVLPLCPKGWIVAKSSRDIVRVAPLGRSEVSGAQVWILFMTGCIGDESSITFWQTGETTDAIPASHQDPQKNREGINGLFGDIPVINVMPQDLKKNHEGTNEFLSESPCEYLGRGSYGHLYVSYKLKPEAKQSWPDPIKSLKAVLVPAK